LAEQKDIYRALPLSIQVGMQTHIHIYTHAQATTQRHMHTHAHAHTRHQVEVARIISKDSLHGVHIFENCSDHFLDRWVNGCVRACMGGWVGGWVARFSQTYPENVVSTDDLRALQALPGGDTS
jgi:hypothetical protein